MRFMKKTRIYRISKQWVGYFLLNQQSLHALLYFVLLFYSHCEWEAQTDSWQAVLYLFALSVALLCNYNFLFALAPYNNTHIAAAAAMFLISLLSCNEKWKAFLFLLALGDSLFYQSDSSQYFLVSFSLLIAFETCRTLLFRTIADNTKYFIGMATVFAYYFISVVSSGLGFHVSVQMTVVLLCMTAALASKVIQYRIDTLRSTNPAELFSQSLMAHYLKLIEQGMANPYWIHTKIVFHSRQCEELHCFCHNEELNRKPEYFIRQLYENALKIFNGSADSMLYQDYISFLLKKDQVINALHFLGEWKPSNYVALMSHMRCRARVEEAMKDQNSGNRYNCEYSFPIEYDRCSQVLALEINEIIKAKLQFWHEINRECSRVARLEKLGLDIVDRMYRLNVFYSKTIRKFEKSIFLFDSTALYAMYLLSTTNFKEYAELIIKKTAKLLEDVYILQSNATETYSIRTVVKKMSKCFILSQSDTLVPLEQDQASGNIIGTSSCKLIIDQVSSGFCKLIGIKRKDLIGCQLNQIIPKGYKEVHNVRLSNLLDFDSESMKQISPSNVIHKELTLPIRAANGRLLNGQICIKSQIDLKEGVTFVSIIKMARGKSSSALMNFQGEVTEVEEGFNIDLLSHSEVAKYLSLLRESWNTDKVIPEEKFNLMVNTANYGVTISSPLPGLFLEKENLKQKCPPIHIDVINEELHRYTTVKGDNKNKISVQIKQIKPTTPTYDTQSSNSHKKNGNSAANILTTYSQASTVPLYRYVQLVFLISIVFCVLSNLGAFYATQLPWDSTVEKGNPLNDTMNLYAIQMLTIKFFLVQGDLNFYFNNRTQLNKTRVSLYFGSSDYQTSMNQLTQHMKEAYVSCIRNSMNPSQILRPAIEEMHTTILRIGNSMGPGSANSSQNMDYIDVLMVYASDISLTNLLSLRKVIISNTFPTQVSEYQNASRLSSVIDDTIHNTQTISIIVHSVLMVAIALLLIPSCCLLHKRLLLHEKVYDLLVSIDSEQVSVEIGSLQYIGNILRNYKESNQIMKMNLIGYQENLIKPKQRKSVSSADNQMILGLQRYDKSNQPSMKRSTLGKDSFLSMIQKSYKKIQMETTIQKRKRSGELNLTGSSLDPEKKLSPSHCALYTISLSFLLILGLSLHYQLQFNSTYISTKNSLLHIFNNQIMFQKSQIKTRFILIANSQIFTSFFGVEALPYIVDTLQSFPSYNYREYQKIFTEVLPNCSNELDNSWLRGKYCQYDYSVIVLLGEFGSLYKDLLELKYNLDHSSDASSQTETAAEINEKLFFMQSLNLKLEDMIMMKVELIFQETKRLSQVYREEKTMLLAVSVAWGVVSCILGFWLILRMKERYFKEVFMITFLSNDMITKNKRVESFLEATAKNVTT